MSIQSNIRIIGGKWRSRKVIFETKASLRPTPNRVRETLFNWLSPYIVGAKCLDLYAGSGVLGFEALSRGAATVLSMERDRENCLCIEQNKKILQAHGMSVLNNNVLDELAREPVVADIVFVDPPYKLNLLSSTFTLLENRKWVHVNSLIYFEQDYPLDPSCLPKSWSLWRTSKAGSVYYYLAIKED